MWSAGPARRAAVGGRPKALQDPKKLAMLQQLYADPANAMLANNLANTRVTLGDALLALGSRDDAREQYLKAQGILLPLFNQNRLSSGRTLIDRIEARLARLDDPNATTAPTTGPDSED